MDERKFCFIICANKERELEECLYYLNKIIVPEGYEIEQIVIRDAISMTSGYNRAMTQSDAKYKIYLHQDVLILNRNILSDLLKIFEESSIGMVGAVGKCDFMASAEYAFNWDVGGAEVSVGTNSRYLILIDESGGTEKLADALCVDGMLMVTQYDLPWEEDTFDGWDFYDISQSVRFQQAGYRVVVPWIHKMEDMWVYHDAGRCVYDAWEPYRKIFCEKYQSLGYEYNDSGILEATTKLNNQRHYIWDIFNTGDFEKTNELLFCLGEDQLDFSLCYVVLFLSIREWEIKTIGTSRFSGADQLPEFIRVFDEVKFMCRRIYFGFTETEKEAAWQKLKEKLYRGEITMKMVWGAACACVGDTKRLWGEVIARYEREISLLIQQGEILGAEQLLQQLNVEERGKWGTILLILIHVFRREVEKNVSPTVFDLSLNADELMEHYVRLKLYLRRLEFGLPVQYWNEVYEYCKNTGVSDYLIFQILRNNIFYKEELCRNLSQIFAREEGEESVRARLYAQLAEK